MMKILLIAQSYYPYNSPGSHRIHSFAKYLPEHGFSPTLLCLDWNRDACLRMRKGAQYTYAATLEGKDVGRTGGFLWCRLSPLGSGVRLVTFGRFRAVAALFLSCLPAAGNS